MQKMHLLILLQVYRRNDLILFLINKLRDLLIPGKHSTTMKIISLIYILNKIRKLNSKMKIKIALILFFISITIFSDAQKKQSPGTGNAYDTLLFNGLHWRNIGPW